MANTTLTDLISLDMLESMCANFYLYSGLSSYIMDAEGVPVTDCTYFYMYINAASNGLIEEDAVKEYVSTLGYNTVRSGNFIIYDYHCGISIFAVPIKYDDDVLGCMIGTGAVRTPENESVDRVQFYTKEHIDLASKYLCANIEMVSKIANGRLKALEAEIKSYISAEEIQHNAETIKKNADMRSDFLANMSHEIRTPMNAVLGMAEMSLREDLPPAAREYISQIKTSGMSLLNIINDILDFSKIDSGKMDIMEEEYTPLSIFNDTANILTTRIGSKPIELLLNINPSFPCKLIGDSQRIKQVLINLSNNAIKFTKKGRVKISLDYEDVSEDTIEMRISVSDTGIGIKKADLEKIFESFSQVDSKRNRNVEGTGLGLAISKRLVELMHGNISVESVYEKGTKFTIRVPQKVVDRSPSIFVRQPESYMITGLFSNRYIARQFYIDAKMLGIFHAALINIDSFNDLLKNYNEVLNDKKLVIFFDEEMFVPALERLINRNNDINFVEIADLTSEYRTKKTNFRIIKKPLSCLTIAMALNNEELKVSRNDRAATFDYTAPDAKILIVDDNEVNLNIAEGLLEPLKMQITRATGGKEAIDLISKNKFDLILMDHMMPEIDGIETTRIIRRLHKEYDEVPIIALTANAMEGSKDMFLSEGMNDFIAKPIEVLNLVNTVRKWLPVEKVKKGVEISEITEESTDTSIYEDLYNIGDLDAEAAIRLLGSEKMYYNLLKEYHKAIPNKAAQIREHLNNKDWPAYTVEVHALKSLSRQAGATELADMAAELEKAGNDRNTEFILKYTEPMLFKYLSYEPLIGALFDDKKEEKKPKKKTKASRKVLSELFDMMSIALDNLDIDLMEEAISGLDKFNYDLEQGELYEKLKEGVANIDIDACDKIIAQWKELI
ncbi:MAG: response regulator [Lachnospiraceae bacterium]|nr:response regulator [Lachnospiraceae bacterium]